MQSSHALRSIVTDDGYRLTLYREDLPGELFDLKNDPLEQHNLYDDPAYAELKVRLMERYIKAFYDQMILWARLTAIRSFSRAGDPNSFSRCGFVGDA